MGPVRRLHALIALVLVTVLALPAGAAPSSSATIEDDCGGDPTQEGTSEIVLAPVDICAVGMTLRNVDDQVVATVVIDVDGGLDDGVPTSHRVGWTGEDGCDRYVEARDETPTAGSSATIVKVDCARDLQVVSDSTLSPDACVGMVDRRRDCLGDPGRVVAIPDEQVERADDRIVITWDVTATLPSDVDDATVASLQPGAVLVDLEARASVRLGHAHQLGPQRSGSSCVMGYCHRAQGTTDELRSTAELVVPHPEQD